jgi:nucleotide-binding universal stress UspA family protein
MGQILVAVDGHPHGEKVVDFAIGLAKAEGAKIILAHAIANKSIPADLRDEYKNDQGVVVKDQYYQDVFDRIADDLQRKIEGAKVAYEGVYGFGNPAKFILATAKSKDVSTIVVGIHGFRRLGRLRALGEVARNVIERSKIPVIAVP